MSTARRLVCSAGLLVLVTCDSGPPATSLPPPPPLDDLLVIDATATVKANRALLPAGFAGPAPTRCSVDPTRAFLVELAKNNPTQPKVPLHWAPVVPGASSDAPTIAQPEFLLAGKVHEPNHSTDDVPFDHVFGYDETFNLGVDEPYADWVYPAASGGELHVEIDQGLLPEKAFGWAVAQGDRALVGGPWILDCGHPPYGAEIHPASFLAFARADEKTTTSLAFYSPYRETQLYSPDEHLVDSFDDDSRYEDVDSKPFPNHFVSELLDVKAGKRTRLDAYSILEPTRFDALTWYVCAPRTRPVGAQLDYSYRFTARSGVTVEANVLTDEGCLRFHATMTSAYRALVPPHQTTPWPWDQISLQATDGAGEPVDVRQKIIDALGGGDYAALALDNPPLIDVYPALAPRADAALDAPTGIVAGADDQPFPFYGRARVAWR